MAFSDPKLFSVFNPKSLPESYLYALKNKKFDTFKGLFDRDARFTYSYQKSGILMKNRIWGDEKIAKLISFRFSRFDFENARVCFEDRKSSILFTRVVLGRDHNLPQPLLLHRLEMKDGKIVDVKISETMFKV